MNKRPLFSADEAAGCVRACHEAGIRTALFLVVGFPGEGEEEFLATCRVVEENAPFIDELKSVNTLHVITGTPLHRHPERWGLCLPETDYHYRWSTADGANTIEAREERARRLVALASRLGIPVRETNLAEQKHRALEQLVQERGRADLVEQLRAEITTLRSV
jgi:radical SAM superfamily enzyme YgiQ (UPF0313 family)